VANILLYIYAFSLPYGFITIGGIAPVYLTGIILSLFLLLELIFKRLSWFRFRALIFLIPVPIYLFFIEAFRASILVAFDFYFSFIANALLFFLMVVSSSKLNLQKALGVLSVSSLIILVIMVSPLREMSDQGRLTALGLNQNYAALLLSTSFIYFLTKMQSYGRTNFSILYGVIAALCFAGVVATGTRFGFLVCGGYLAWMIYSNLTRSGAPFYMRLGFLVIGSLAVITLMSLDLYVFTRFLEIEDELSSTTGGRFFLWGVAITSVGDNIWFGIGPTTYASIIVPLMGSYMSPHNLFFEFFLYSGLIGVLLALPYIYYPLTLLMKSFNLREGPNITAGVCTIVIFILLLHHILFNKLFWLLMAWIIKSLDSRSFSQ
tara:strand:+ start:3063 stop:4193 length:1131 start_codon:yes stop_codon:yes gene_type:complete